MDNTRCIRKIKQIDFHRNGVGGGGFYAVLFDATNDYGGKNFLSIVFGESGSVAVINLDLIPEHGVTFGRNSWRGDHYEPELRVAIKKETE